MSKGIRGNESEQWVDLLDLAAEDELRGSTKFGYIDKETECCFISVDVDIVMTLIATEPCASAFSN